MTPVALLQPTCAEGRGEVAPVGIREIVLNDNKTLGPAYEWQTSVTKTLARKRSWAATRALRLCCAEPLMLSRFDRGRIHV